MTDEKKQKTLKYLIDYISIAMQEKITGKIIIDFHEGGVRDMSISRKIKISKLKS